jgi:hypothetical protein
MAVRFCRVTCRDSQGIEHTAQVSAQSLYEAVALALRAFRDADWTDSPERGPNKLVVTVRQPEVEHRVNVQDFWKWLNAAGKSPAEMALKNRLRELLNHS